MIPKLFPQVKILGLGLQNVADDDFFMYFKRQSPGVLKFFDSTVEPSDRMHFKNIRFIDWLNFLIGAEAHLEANADKALEYLNEGTRSGPRNLLQPLKIFLKKELENWFLKVNAGIA